MSAITPKCFNCSSTLEYTTISKKSRYSRIEFCTQKCLDLFKERLIDKDDGDIENLYMEFGKIEISKENKSPSKDTPSPEVRHPFRRYPNISFQTVRNLTKIFEKCNKMDD